MIFVEVIDRREQIKQYYPEWNTLFRSRNYESSLSVSWTDALLNSYLEDCAMYLIVLKDSAGIAGLVPLYVKEIKKAGVSLLTLFPAWEHFNTHSDLLLRDASDELTAAFMKAVFSLKSKWDVFRINRFVDGHPLLSGMESYLRTRIECRYQIETTEPSFFIGLGNDYGKYLNTLSGQFRYKIKHASQRLQSRGELLCRRECECQDFDETFNSILAIEEASWKHVNGSGISSTDKQRRFYRELCRGEFKEGRLRVWILYLNHAPVAYEMGLVNHRKYYSVHGSFDEAVKKENPGTVLLARVIEHLIQEGIEELDWFGEPFEFQRHWTDRVRWHRSVLIYNNTLKARVFYAYNYLKNVSKPNRERELVLRSTRHMRLEHK